MGERDDEDMTSAATIASAFDAYLESTPTLNAMSPTHKAGTKHAFYAGAFYVLSKAQFRAGAALLDTLTKECEAFVGNGHEHNGDA